MKIIKHVLICGLVLLGLGSCVGDVDFASGYEKKVVVNCVLKNRDVQHLSLTYNKPLGSNADAEKITEAKASLWNADTDTKVGEFEYNGEDWVMSYTPSPGVKYRLKIDGIEGQPHIEAETEYPLFSYNGVDYPSAWEMFVDYHAPLCWVSFYKKSDGGALLKLLDKLYVRRYSVRGDKEIIDVDNFNETEEVVQYGTWWDDRKWEACIHKYFVRVYGGEWVGGYDGKHGIIGTYFPIVPYSSASHVCFLFPSKEYDLYMKSAVTIMNSRLDKSDILSNLDEAECYSNIHNGLGIFGACEENREVYRLMEF